MARAKRQKATVRKNVAYYSIEENAQGKGNKIDVYQNQRSSRLLQNKFKCQVKRSRTKINRKTKRTKNILQESNVKIKIQLH